MDGENTKIMELDVTLDEREIIDYSLRLAYSGVLIILLTAAGVISLLMLLVMAWAVLSKGYKPPALAFLPVFLVLFSIYVPFGVKKSAKNAWATNESLHHTQHYRITENGVSDVDSDYTWEDLYKVLETKSYFALFIFKDLAFLLPKRCFDDTTNNMIRQILRRKIPSAKLKLQADISRY